MSIPLWRCALLGQNQPTKHFKRTAEQHRIEDFLSASRVPYELCGSKTTLLEVKLTLQKHYTATKVRALVNCIDQMVKSLAAWQ